MIDTNKAVSPRAILLLCHFYPEAAGAIIDHIDAFRKFSENEYFILSNLGDLPEWLDLSRFDAIVFHYSLIACNDNYISPVGRKRIRDFQGFKAAFVQDDYRWINDTVNALAYMRINALFPLTNPDIMDAIYDPAKLTGVRRETVLAGYVPQSLVELKVKPFCERAMDVVYRARKLPAWMGSHTLQKWQIADRFSKDAPRYGLKVDLSYCEEDRIYGEQWIDFVANSRATLGTESGASVCDFTGTIQLNVEAHEKKYLDADFETLRDLYFKDEDCKILMNVISPRCFEAAALRTLMILYEGTYSGVLKPWRHYVPLKLDHSNMDEVARILALPEEAQKIVDQAYNEVAKNVDYSYAAMVRLVDRVMTEEWPIDLEPASNLFFKKEFDWLVAHNPQIIENINTVKTEKAILYPASAFLVPVNVSPEAFEKFRLSLGASLQLGAVAIRWNAFGSGVTTHFILRGLSGRKVQFVQEVINANGTDFQIINFSTKTLAVDSLEVCSSVEGTQGLFQPLYVAVLGKVKVVPILKRVAAWGLAYLWQLLPDGVRSTFRPIVRPIRIRLKGLFK